MAIERRKAAKGSFALKAVLVLTLSFILAAVVGFGIASANGDSVVESGSFGIDAQQGSSTKGALFASGVSEVVEQPAAIEAPQARDISDGVNAIEEEEAEAARKAEEARLAAEKEKIDSVRQAEQEQLSVGNGEAIRALDDVDWEVGEEAFIAEWTDRIDAYLAGSALAGQGKTFAEAAWKYGVDPRWSPAISNTESSKGAICFKPYNAWGWGDSSWSSWEEAIDAHVAGLAKGYGYSLSKSAAVTYCPPNAEHWYNNTFNQMSSM